MKLAEEREEGYAEGRAEGRAEGHLDAVRNLMETMNLTMEQAMAALKIPMEELEHYQEPKAARSNSSINKKEWVGARQSCQVPAHFGLFIYLVRRKNVFVKVMRKCKCQL